MVSNCLENNVSLGVKQRNVYQENMTIVKSGEEKEFGWWQPSQEDKQVELIILEESIVIQVEGLGEVVTRTVDGQVVVVRLQLEGVTKRIIVEHQKQ